MYAIDFTLYRSSAAWLLDDIYDGLAQTYALPQRSVLLAALEASFHWEGIQAYYLDSLIEENRRHVYELRFKTREGAHDFTTLFVSLEDAGQVHGLSIRFPARGDRHCSSKMLGWIKEWKIKFPALEVEFELQGYGEREGLRFIREHSLSAFVWEEKLRRYLHVTDHFHEVKEIKKGL